MESLFKIIAIEGKGVGWVALHDIKIGTLILKEKCQLEPKIQNDLWSLIESFFSMTKFDQEDFLRLSNPFKDLPDLIKSRKEGYGNWMAFANHYSIQKPEVDRELVLKIICIFESNKFVDSSVAIKSSRINHSCCSNAFCYKRNDSMEVRATHKIKKGQEITMSYDGDKWQCTMQNRKKRQEFIRAEYGFTCQCESCQDEELNDNDEFYERFRKIMENKQIFDNLIDLKIVECHSQNTLEDGTMEKYPGESQEEFKNRHYSEILQIVNNRHFCFIQLYNLARDKKAPKEFILTILKEAVKCLNFGIKFVEHEFAEPYQFIDKMKFFEEESKIVENWTTNCRDVLWK